MLHYLTGGSGPPLVLLHGFPDFSAGGWLEAMAMLARRWRVIAPDLRGFNLSGRPAGLAAYALPRLVEDLASVLGVEGIGRVALAGHDWGGAVAWWFATLAPRRVERLAVVSAPHPADYLAARADPANAAFFAYQAELVRPGPLDFARWSAWPEAPEARARLRAALERSDAEAIRDLYRANLAAPPVPFDPPAVTVPTRLIHGDADPVVPEAAYAGAVRRVAAPFARDVIAGGGHFVHATAAEAVVDAIERFPGG